MQEIAKGLERKENDRDHNWCSYFDDDCIGGQQQNKRLKNIQAMNEKEAIRHQMELFVTAFRNKDMDLMMSLFAANMGG